VIITAATELQIIIVPLNISQTQLGYAHVTNTQLRQASASAAGKLSDIEGSWWDGLGWSGREGSGWP